MVNIGEQLIEDILDQNEEVELCIAPDSQPTSIVIAQSDCNKDDELDPVKIKEAVSLLETDFIGSKSISDTRLSSVDTRFES